MRFTDFLPFTAHFILLVRGIPFETTLPKEVITRSEALEALEDMFDQAKDVPEMSLDEINEEIAQARAARKAAI